MAKPSSIAKAIAARARQQMLLDSEARMKAKRRERERKAVADANAVTPDGYTPAMRAKLQAASKKASEDPRQQAVVEQAALQFRIEQLRREKGIGQVSPPMFMGEPADSQGRPIINDPKLIPKSVGEQIKAGKK